MPDESNISLTDSNVGGNFTGRDSLNFNTVFAQSEYMQKLYDDFQAEKESDSALKEICDELDYLTSQVENDSVIGLEDKLKAGGREKILFYASTVKERFHKKLLLTSQYSLIAQDINVHILHKVKRAFMIDVYTLICNDVSEEKINAMINEVIIKPVMSELGINLFKYSEDDIMGMIFFLTGNCHIKWSK